MTSRAPTHIRAPFIGGPYDGEIDIVTPADLPGAPYTHNGRRWLRVAAVSVPEEEPWNGRHYTLCKCARYGATWHWHWNDRAWLWKDEEHEPWEE